MIKDFRYKLEKGSKKHVCPNCNKKTFVYYIDIETGEYLTDNYGRCDRENKCGFHVLPPPETLCYFVYFDKLKDITEKAILIIQGANEQVIPKKAVLEYHSTGVFVAEYFLKDKGNRNIKPIAISYNENNYKYFKDDEAVFSPLEKKPLPKIKTSPVFFDFDTFKKTLEPERYEHNIFIQNLFYSVKYPFDIDEVTKVIQLYRLGTVNKGYRAGAVTFPFIDVNDNIRAIQVKQFDKSNHTTGTDFLHSIIEKSYTSKNKPLPFWLSSYKDQEKKVSCLFGEHLLNRYKGNPVALVEAPKTAVYGTLYFGIPETPDSLIWLAVYNKSSFSFEKLKVLQGRKILVFPDLSKDGNTFNEWQSKAKEYETKMTGTRFVFSDLLEQLAPKHDKTNGYDIADYLIKQDWRPFRNQFKNEPTKTDDNEQNNEIEYFETEISKQQREIERLERECKDLENSFIQASKGCKIKWYAPEFITEPHESNRIKQLIYWCS
jgi:hypothetical protein